MKVEIYGLNHQGMGIGRINNKIIFVEHALIGEIVEVKIIKEYKKYMVGEVVKIIKSSSYRCNNHCKYYLECGGCNIGILNYNKQLEFKKSKVIDIFKKYGNIKVNPDIVGSSSNGYRNKITLHVYEGKLGYYKKNSNDIVKIDKCVICDDKINYIISIIEKKLDLNNVTKIVIRASSIESMVVFYGEVDISKVIMYLSFVTSVYINDKLVIGKDKIIFKLDNYKFSVSKDSFFQVNSKQAEKLYKQVLEYANLNKDDKVLDLYCGTGTIGIYLANHCKEVLGIELNPSCVEDARGNAISNNIENINFVCDSSSIINKLDIDVDVVVVDPPRSGLDSVTIDTLNNSKINRIIYVSCNPMTLIRDINLLSDNYELKDIKLFDMFAFDYHIEILMVLERKIL